MKTTIRLILLAALIILSVTSLIAQTKDVVYLKNGSVIKGAILEMIPDKTIKIQTADGNIFVYSMSEVDKISKETVTPGTESKQAVDRSANEGQRSYESQSSSGGSGAKFSIFGGIALPTGVFAKKLDEDENAGGAKLGWTAGAQLVTGGSVGFLIEGSYSQNKYDIPTSDMPAGKLEKTGWNSILALAGIKFGTDNSTGTNFFIAPVAGALFEKSPEVTFTLAGATQPLYTSEARSGSGFAYGVIAEAIIGGQFTLSAQFVASKPKFKWSAPLYMGGPSKDYEEERNISLLLVTLGIAF